MIIGCSETVVRPPVYPPDGPRNRYAMALFEADDY